METPASIHPAAAPKSRRSREPQQQIIRYISQFTTLSEADAAEIVRNMKFRTFKKGAVLLKEGQAVKLCYFVLKGCIRQYFLVDGEEKTTNFYTEGQPVTPYEGTYKRVPSKYYLACVEDTIVTISSPEGEVSFFEKFPHLESVSRLAVEEELGKSQDRFTSFILNSPEERYLDLLKNRPDLLDRVPQYQLASFLGVTPESLSRIRKRIMIK
ncbi:MAG TPA: Crp/Fnr family transcriptional regulator [Saprospiraceae bacterium]|nr:Crp/Fnr family transcriptional regulator [Saprospiraceae bacterium]HPI04931.1 Crp/Fnr family transcriptional regulator [Saprospiraceae bacterium]